MQKEINETKKIMDTSCAIQKYSQLHGMIRSCNSMLMRIKAKNRNKMKEEAIKQKKIMNFKHSRITVSATKVINARQCMRTERHCAKL